MPDAGSDTRSDARSDARTQATPAAADDAELSLLARDVHLTYEVYTDQQRPTLRRMVTRRFQSRTAREVHAVRGVSLATRRGEAVGLIGRNGSGKSTLLRVFAGLLPATSGAVYASSDPVLLGVGAALHPELSGRRNVFLGGTALGIPRDELEDRYDEIVAFAGLEDFMDMPLRTYSSGMRARLQFSVATIVTPDILLIDEALAVGDQEFKRESERRIREMCAAAGTVVLVSHSLRSILDVCSRAVWLDRGRIQADGPAEEVVETYRQATDGSAG